MAIDKNEKNERPCVRDQVTTVVALLTADGRSRKATPANKNIVAYWQVIARPV